MFATKMKMLDHVVECLSKTRLDDMNSIFRCVNEDAKGKTVSVITDWDKPEGDKYCRNFDEDEDVDNIKEYKVLSETYNEEGLKVESFVMCKSRWNPEVYTDNEIEKCSYDNNSRLVKIVDCKKNERASILYTKTAEITYGEDEIKIVINMQTEEYGDEEKQLLIRKSSDIEYYSVSNAKSEDTEVIRMNLNNRAYLTQYVVDGKIAKLVDHRNGETHYFMEK